MKIDASKAKEPPSDAFELEQGKAIMYRVARKVGQMISGMTDESVCRLADSFSAVVVHQSASNNAFDRVKKWLSSKTNDLPPAGTEEILVLTQSNEEELIGEHERAYEILMTDEWPLSMPLFIRVGALLITTELVFDKRALDNGEPIGEAHLKKMN